MSNRAEGLPKLAGPALRLALREAGSLFGGGSQSIAGVYGREARESASLDRGRGFDPG